MNRTYRYPPKVIRFAQELREANPDRPIESIRQACGRFGPVPSANTVRCWVDPDFALTHRIRNRMQMRRGTVRTKEDAVTVLSKRMADLRKIGVSYRAISAIFRLDYGVDLDEERLRYAHRYRNGRVRVRPRDFEVTA